ncbi:MAG: hypothetical protein HPKKFMNG_01826 [Planctomycetes bacterium]|nr:hypothetical protein [Planctomycetota bacterium]MCQ3948700.1 hypothetical protein [Planctomycetota bacterium]GIK51697.1 MAG: hypothetical protein BroJett014_06700 [Planctomycetota bacterium]HRJ79520.1 hypothetical protein [Planctomycetota bacterium]
MATLVVDAVASARLSRQFEQALRRSPARDAAAEARRFVGYLCDRLERNNRALCVGPVEGRPGAYEAGRAARQGESVLLTCMFLLDDLAWRVGRQTICEHLAATNTLAGRALARRLEMRPNHELRISSVRFCITGAQTRAIEAATVAAPHAGTGAVQATLAFNGSYPGRLCIGLCVENAGVRTAHFVAAHARLYARYARSEGYVPANGDAFGFLERVAGCEGQVLAMRGFEIMELLRGVDPRGRDPLEAKIICRLV